MAAPDPGSSEELPWPERSAGILLHPTSLPGGLGSGDLGPDARRFVDLLESAGQSVWQMMPLAPPGPGNSPYAARSVFAGSPLLISAHDLVEDGLLEKEDIERRADLSADRVDFAGSAGMRDELLRLAFQRYGPTGHGAELDAFIEANRGWLPDFALFMAIRRERGGDWATWPPGIARRGEAMLDEERERLEGEVRYHEFGQWCFSRQWTALKRYANDRGVKMFGDLPIFPDYDSADVWSNQRLFKLDGGGRPEVVAGVPPDAFSSSGQRWGNPLYRWDVLEGEGYGWWMERLRRNFSLFDLVRLDHFRGFEAAWEIPAANPTAEHGTWVPGPGTRFFDAVRSNLGDVGIVVEDLGVIGRSVRKLRDSLGYPGMKVLQFAFGDDARNPYLPHNYPENCVVYTGTHDNDTTLGWFRTLDDGQRHSVLRYLARDGTDIVSDLIRLACSSVAAIAVIPMQDVLNLGAEARTNVPGRASGNWGWRFRWEQVETARIDWLRQLAVSYGRARGKEQ